MKSIAILICLALAGCSNIVSYKVWAKAEELCQNNDGVAYVDAQTSVPSALIHGVAVFKCETGCRNGAKFTFEVEHRKEPKP